MAHRVEQGGAVVLVLTRAEADALRAIASEGASGLYTDPAAAAGFIGSATVQSAGRRALTALGVWGYES